MKIKTTLAGVGLVVGLLVAIQIRSYENVAALVQRDSKPADIFQQIYVLRLASESLKEEISLLETQLDQYLDQTSAYDTIVAEIEKNEILLGIKPIQGDGIKLIIEPALAMEWMVDLSNELWSAGAEAVSINGVRLTETASGFYQINDLIFINGTELKAPYQFEAIGDANVMTEILNQPGGILVRLEADYGAENYSIEKTTISMDQSFSFPSSDE